MRTVSHSGPGGSEWKLVLAVKDLLPGKPASSSLLNR
jgi:hypothetical protein